MFCRLKAFRCVATRYDRTPQIFLAAVCIAATVGYWLATGDESGTVMRRRVAELARDARKRKGGHGQTEGANYKSPFARKPQISLAFVPQKSNGRDALTGTQAPAGDPADRMIGEFFGPARLVPSSGLAVVTATAPSPPRG